MFGKFKKIFSQSVGFLKNNQFKKFFGLDPKNNWILFIILFLVLNILLLFGKLSEFYEIGSDKALILKEEQSENVETINRSGLNRVLSKLEIQEANYKDFKVNRSNLRDPSI